MGDSMGEGPPIPPEAMARPSGYLAPRSAGAYDDEVDDSAPADPPYGRVNARGAGGPAIWAGQREGCLPKNHFTRDFV